MSLTLEHPTAPLVPGLGDGRAPRETVGHFQFGRVIDNRPIALPDWRVSTDDLRVAEEVAAILGGTVEECVSHDSGPFEVATKSSVVQVLIDGPCGISMDMKLWDARGLIHHCDGVAFLSPVADEGRPCGCPRTMSDRKEHAKSGQGPQPNTVLTFRLVGVSDLGVFRFQSSSWRLAATVQDLRGALAALDGPALCELSLERVKFRTRSGRTVSYFKPTLEVIGLDCANEVK
ncbi:recombination directionality factor [Streptomyces lydicus]|uniref:recombination directionality factor n=1 Tax=Streptomyces lydicus TaxID=47763 RepID=UPI0036EA4051